MRTNNFIDLELSERTLSKPLSEGWFSQVGVSFHENLLEVQTGID